MDPPPPPPRSPWLRSGDQAAAAPLLALGLGVIAFCHWYQGGWHRQLIEIEQAAPVQLDYMVDINRADAVEFMVLPEIGEALSQRIVAERIANGPFRDHSDLRRVRGIGPKTLDRIKPYLLPMAEAEAVAGN